MRQPFLRSLCFILFFFSASIVTVAQTRRDALLEYRQGNYAAAVEICTAEIAEAPTNMDSYAVLCWSLVALGKHDEAANFAVQARSINRYDPRIVEVLGEARFHQGRNEEALKLFQEYVTLAPEGGRIDVAYYFMGEIYVRLGRYRHADIALSTAVRHAPGNAKWWTRLGYAREKANDVRYAVGAYEKALGIDPQSVDAQRGLERTRGALNTR